MKAIATKDIIDINGNVTIEKGKEYDVSPYIREGMLLGQNYIYKKILGHRYNGKLYMPDVFSLNS